MNKNKMVAPHCSENLNSMIFTTIYCQYFIRNINDFIICRLFFTPTNIDFWQSPKFFHRYICWAYLMSPVRDGVISKPKFDIFNLLRVLTSQKFPIVICSPYRLNNTTEDFLRWLDPMQLKNLSFQIKWIKGDESSDDGHKTINYTFL